MKEINLMVHYPKSNRKLFYNKRRKLARKGYVKYDISLFNNEDLIIENAMLSKAREFGYEYFDGDRLYGYGGYYYSKKYWYKTAKNLIDYYKLTDGMKVLDVGCAKGFLLFEIKKINPKIEVFGLDISNYAIDNSKKEVKNFLKLGSAEKLPFKNNFFDLVVSINTIDHLELNKCKNAISEIERVKKTNSFICVNSWHNLIQKDNLISWNLVSKTIMDVEDWRLLFRECKYTGDYFWFIAD